MDKSDNSSIAEEAIRDISRQERYSRINALIRSLYYLATEADGINLIGYGHFLRYVAEEIRDTLPDPEQSKHQIIQGETDDVSVS